MSVWTPSTQACPKVSDLWGRKRLISVQLYKLSLLVLTSPSQNLSPSCKGYSNCSQNLGNPFSRAGKRLLSTVSCHHSYHETEFGINERTWPHSLISRGADNCLNHSEDPTLCFSVYIIRTWCCWITKLEDSRCHKAICSVFPKNCYLSPQLH